MTTRLLILTAFLTTLAWAVIADSALLAALGGVNAGVAATRVLYHATHS